MRDELKDPRRRIEALGCGPVKIDADLRKAIQTGVNRNRLLEDLAKLVELYQSREVEMGREPLQGLARWDYVHGYGAELAAYIAQHIRSMKT